MDCQDCESEGIVVGHLRVVGLLSLKASSGVEGEIRYGRMSVEAGAKIEGVCKLDDGVKPSELMAETQMMSVDHENGPLQQTA